MLTCRSQFSFLPSPSHPSPCLTSSFSLSFSYVHIHIPADGWRGQKSPNPGAEVTESDELLKMDGGN